MIDTNFSTGLTSPETERLALLLEEMGEAQQIIGKILRHGYASSNPLKPNSENNREMLTRELGDVLVAIDLMTAAQDIHAYEIEVCKQFKQVSVKQWMHYQS
jgi:hypothetical protein